MSLKRKLTPRERRLRNKLRVQLRQASQRAQRAQDEVMAADANWTRVWARVQRFDEKYGKCW